MLKGRLLFNQEKEREAIKVFKSAAKSGKNKGMAYMMDAYACLNLEDSIEARKFTEKGNVLQDSINFLLGIDDLNVG